ncbi:MAG: GNAT family N-acetyltransferase [bacterium]|nr:GNAT family N-acetyltransferase [bacterium]
MKFITIDPTNLDSEHVCCAIGADQANTARAATKKEWMRARFKKDGLVFKRLDERGKMFVEYMPIESVWKPISGKNYLVINCLWVSGKFKGRGVAQALLDECVKDAKKQKRAGVAVVTSNRVKPFLTDPKFYKRHGFETVDTAPPYFELLALRLDPRSPAPKFKSAAKAGRCENKQGFTFIYSNQCPFMEEYVQTLAGIAAGKKAPTNIVKLKTGAEARRLGSPFGTLGIYYQGELVAHDLMPEKKFGQFVDGLLQS